MRGICRGTDLRPVQEEVIRVWGKPPSAAGQAKPGRATPMQLTHRHHERGAFSVRTNDLSAPCEARRFLRRDNRACNVRPHLLPAAAFSAARASLNMFAIE
jgi:hypothetical protein